MNLFGPLLGVAALYCVCWALTRDAAEAFKLTAGMTGIAIFMALGKGGRWWK